MPPKKETSLATITQDREAIDLIKQTVAKGATDTELKLFLYTAGRTGLDPLTRQIFFIKRRNWNPRTNSYDEVGTIQTGIDGYRAVATRTKQLAGEDDAVFDKEDGTHPGKASVTVYRMVEGQRMAFTASARWAEYVQTGKDGMPANMWKKMPYLMLAKCAAALAYRKAFPNDLSGLYTNEEMSQADNNLATLPETPTRPNARSAAKASPVDQPDAPSDVPVISQDEPTGQGGVLVSEQTDQFYTCEHEGCGKDITVAERQYSVRVYGVPLCRAHQKVAKKITN